MKENRYFQMVYLLLERGNMTAPELAEYFEVSVRTIYRDIDILSSAGVPIYATQDMPHKAKVVESLFKIILYLKNLS